MPEQNDSDGGDDVSPKGVLEAVGKDIVAAVSTRRERRLVGPPPRRMTTLGVALLVTLAVWAAWLTRERFVRTVELVDKVDIAWIAKVDDHVSRSERDGGYISDLRALQRGQVEAERHREQVLEELRTLRQDLRQGLSRVERKTDAILLERRINPSSVLSDAPNGKYQALLAAVSNPTSSLPK